MIRRAMFPALLLALMPSLVAAQISDPVQPYPSGPDDPAFQVDGYELVVEQYFFDATNFIDSLAEASALQQALEFVDEFDDVSGGAYMGGHVVLLNEGHWIPGFPPIPPLYYHGVGGVVWKYIPIPDDDDDPGPNNPLDWYLTANNIVELVGTRHGVCETSKVAGLFFVIRFERKNRKRRIPVVAFDL